MKKYLALISLVVFLAGCTASEQQPRAIMPVPQPVVFQEPPPTYRNPGSLFDANNANYLFADSRARRVGDIVMVHVVESSTATNSANTNASRSSSTEFEVDSLFARTSILGGAIGGDPLISTSTTRSHTGSGTTTRKNTVSATVAARVINVLPDGLLQIEGARETAVNNETQFLVVTGLIRARDISADNSIMSTQVADAHIAYYGKGVVSDKQRPGWLARLMDNVWPF